MLVQAKNPADEIDFITNRIEELVKKYGYRYRDIALVCGDLSGYGREITRSFEENRIPLFLDENRDVSGNPLIRLIQSALDILQKGFDYESMFRYLRTGLVRGDGGRGPAGDLCAGHGDPGICEVGRGVGEEL